MPKITSLTVQTKNKNRCNLFLDGEFFAGISTETAMKNRLKVGMEVDERFISSVILEIEKNQALIKATEYITKYLKTKYQVKDYLVRKGYSEEIAWYCVDKLKEYNYIDDLEYSKRFIESQAKNNGKKMLEYKLMMKGVKKQDIFDAYSGVEINEKENARLIADKYLKNKERTLENKAKAYRYLSGKGFSYEEISSVLDDMFKED